MDNHRRIMLTSILVFFSGFVLPASPKQHTSISAQRSMRYTSRPTNDAKAWQSNVRTKLLQLLKMDELIPKRSSIAFSPEELSHADRGTYHVKEVEISSTLSRRIRVIVTIPNSIEDTVPAVVCIGGHGEGHVIDLPGLVYFFEKHLYQNRWEQKEGAEL